MMSAPFRPIPSGRWGLTAMAPGCGAKRPILAGVMLVSIALAAPAQEPAPSDVPFDMFELDNGLRVILAEDRSAPTSSIAVVYDVGSRNEERGQTGFAHLIEHLMFQGSDNVGRGEHFVLVQNNGGGAGARTTADHTSYYQTLPANQLDLGLFLEADRMRSLDFSETSFNAQRDVVAGERRVRHDNAPYGLTEETILETVYDNFAYGHPVIGSMDDLNRATLDEVREFFRNYYAPNNAVIALVGDFDSEEALANVERYFGDIPAQSSLPEVFVEELPQAQERRATIQDDFARLPQLDIVFRGPPGSSPQWYMMAILGDILASEQRGRLYRRFVEEQQVALDFAARIDERRGNSLFRISAIPAAGTELEDLEAMIHAEIDRLKLELVEESELERARAQMEQTESQRLQGTMARAITLAANEVYYRDPGLINRHRASLDGTTRESIMRAADIYLRESNRTVVVTRPTNSATVLGGRRP